MARRVFYRHWIGAASIVIAGSLGLGTVGYHETEGMPWIDALLNASMILGGMGPVSTLHTWEGKLFASFYALYSCFIVLGLAGLLLMPVMHDVLHHFHRDPERDARPLDPKR